jgi:hypothetical protein
MDDWGNLCAVTLFSASGTERTRLTRIDPVILAAARNAANDNTVERRAIYMVVDALFRPRGDRVRWDQLRIVNLDAVARNQ